MKRGKHTVYSRNGEYLNAGEFYDGEGSSRGHPVSPSHCSWVHPGSPAPCSGLSNYIPCAFLSCSCSRQLLRLFSLYPLRSMGNKQLGRVGWGTPGEAINHLPGPKGKV